MLSPYIKEVNEIKVLVNDKFFNWVYDNRYNSETTVENIKSFYDKFIIDFESIVK